VEGNLKATNLVAVMDKAKIKGNIITPVGGLEMKIGSEFVGKFITNKAD
jgi:cytoskeletal protein CcmA (bactofilin family)